MWVTSQHKVQLLVAMLWLPGSQQEQTLPAGASVSKADHRYSTASLMTCSRMLQTTFWNEVTVPLQKHVAAALCWQDTRQGA